MKKVTIKQNKDFNKQIEEILINKGAENGVCEWDDTRNTFRLVGKVNSFTFLMEDNVGSQCYSVFGRFDKPNNLTNNCKFNFHHGTSDINQTVFEFVCFYLQDIINHLN
jgi:hypothetical protein